MFGMIKQTSFQLMDAVKKCWSSTVGRLLTRDNILVYLDLTRLPPRESTLDGRWTRKPFGLSRVQPIYLSIPRPS